MIFGEKKWAKPDKWINTTREDENLKYATDVKNI